MGKYKDSSMDEAFSIFPVIGFLVVIILIVVAGIKNCWNYSFRDPAKPVESSITNTVIIDGVTCQIYIVGEERLKYISCPNNCSTTVENRPRLISADPVIYDDHKESVSSCLPASGK